MGAPERHSETPSEELQGVWRRTQICRPKKEGQRVKKKSSRDRSEAGRVEGKRKKQGQEVTWIQTEESLSSGLVTSKRWRFCVCVLGE